MTGSNLLAQLREQNVVERPLTDLAEILADAEVVQDLDTKLAGRLRILRVGGEVVLQEQHPDQRVLLLRRMDSLEAAEVLVRDRLETYDRMWDGCGCKVDYYG